MRARLVAAAIVVAALAAPSVASADLTNLDHLDFLGASVTPPAQADHTTFALGTEPSVGVLWTYADADGAGGFRRVGGGAYDAATDTYGQGAFNADDLARAAVVYVRHWRATGSATSRAHAYALLRGLTFMQTASGPNAGNVVLWMQPDGTLHPSAEPHEDPDPSDSGPSYWLARTVWALGEGQRAFARSDPAFAAFLRGRLDLAIAALDRQVLSRYGTYLTVDGRRVPAWLIVDGADATAEAMLGLAAYDSPAARRALSRFAEGVAALGAGSPLEWPYGALLPWALSRAHWHAWASQMPAALAGSGRRDLLGRAVADAASFTPQLLVSGGPDNGWFPTPTDRTQIAYGADSRLQSLLAVARAARRPGLRRLAGVAASWYFGANASGAPTYDPATGVTFDGVAADGTVNHNSGAESTIHGLLSMLALDGAPDVARWARVSGVVSRRAGRVAEAESVGGPVVTPPSAWTGESAWSGGAYVDLPAGGKVAFGPVHGVVEAVALTAPDGGTTSWGPLGTLSHVGADPQGSSPAPGVLDVRRLGFARSVTARGTSGTVALDAIQVTPPVESVVLRGAGHSQALLRSFADRERRARVPVAGAVTSSYDARGRLVARTHAARVRIPPGGFAIAER